MGKEEDSSLNMGAERGGKALETRGKVSKTFPPNCLVSCAYVRTHPEGVFVIYVGLAGAFGKTFSLFRGSDSGAPRSAAQSGAGGEQLETEAGGYTVWW